MSLNTFFEIQAPALEKLSHGGSGNCINTIQIQAFSPLLSLVFRSCGGREIDKEWSTCRLIKIYEALNLCWKSGLSLDFLNGKKWKLTSKLNIHGHRNFCQTIFKRQYREKNYVASYPNKFSLCSWRTRLIVFTTSKRRWRFFFSSHVSKARFKEAS